MDNRRVLVLDLNDFLMSRKEPMTRSIGREVATQWLHQHSCKSPMVVVSIHNSHSM